jgi:hypothetical protein
MPCGMGSLPLSFLSQRSFLNRIDGFSRSRISLSLSFRRSPESESIHFPGGLTPGRMRRRFYKTIQNESFLKKQ